MDIKGLKERNNVHSSFVNVAILVDHNQGSRIEIDSSYTRHSHQPRCADHLRHLHRAQFDSLEQVHPHPSKKIMWIRKLRRLLGPDKLIRDGFKPLTKIVNNIVYVFCSHGKSNKILQRKEMSDI